MPDIGINETIYGDLTITDPEDPTYPGQGYLSDDYNLIGTVPGQEVTVTMTGDFGPWLALLDANDLTMPINGAGGWDGRAILVFTPQAGISYVIRASSWNPGGTGPYVLKTESAEVAPPAPAPEITKNQTINGQLETTDQGNPSRPGSYCDDYKLIGINPGDNITLDLRSNAFDTYLQLVNADTGNVITFNDDYGSTSRSYIEFIAEAGINYIIRVTSRGAGSVGPYSIEVTGPGGDDIVPTITNVAGWDDGFTIVVTFNSDVNINKTYYIRFLDIHTLAQVGGVTDGIAAGPNATINLPWFVAWIYENNNYYVEVSANQVDWVRSADIFTWVNNWGDPLPGHNFPPAGLSVIGSSNLVARTPGTLHSESTLSISDARPVSNIAYLKSGLYDLNAISFFSLSRGTKASHSIVKTDINKPLLSLAPFSLFTGNKAGYSHFILTKTMSLSTESMFLTRTEDNEILNEATIKASSKDSLVTRESLFSSYRAIPRLFKESPIIILKEQTQGELPVQFRIISETSLELPFSYNIFQESDLGYQDSGDFEVRVANTLSHYGLSAFWQSGQTFDRNTNQIVPVQIEDGALVLDTNQMWYSHPIKISAYELRQIVAASIKAYSPFGSNMLFGIRAAATAEETNDLLFVWEANNYWREFNPKQFVYARFALYHVGGI